MKRITLAVVAVLLAVPALAQAKAGIEFDQNIEAQQAGDRQNFSVFVHGSSGGPPTVSFHNTRTGEVIDVKTVRSNQMDSRGSVRFPDSGPWTATILVAGRPVTDQMQASEFELLPPAPKPKPAATPPPAPSDDGFPLWLLTLPAAGIAAIAIWLVRRRPRELGA